MKKIILLVCVVMLLSISAAYAQDDEGDEEGYQPLGEIDPPALTELSVSADGSTIAIGAGPRRCIPMGYNGRDLLPARLRILDAETAEEINYVNGLSCEYLGLEWAPVGTRLAVLNIYNLMVLDVTAIVDHGGGDARDMDEITGRIAMSSLSWRSDGQYLASSSISLHDVLIHDVITGELVYRIDTDTNVAAVDWSTTGALLAFADFDTGTQIWDFQNITEPQLLRTLPVWANNLAWSPDDTRIATTGLDVVIIDAETGEAVQTLVGHTDIIKEIEWSSDGIHLATGSLDRTIRVWNTLTGEEVAQYPVTTYEAAFDWMPDGERLAYAVTLSDTDPMFTIVTIPGVGDADATNPGG